ncbi:MAG: DUF624 domain-containing protein [Clostridiales bacterium]|nr:DUF624 domain-containing protein [Clostridiales bacterium]
MGIFRNVDQPGPGVYANEQREGPVIRFFRVLALRFFTICLCNILFVLVNIPVLALMYLLFTYVMPLISPSLTPIAIMEAIEKLGAESASANGAVEEVAGGLYSLLILIGAFAIIGLTLVVIGPFQTAFSYVYRNYSRESLGFFWQDFVRSLKENWKQSLAVSFISLLLTVVLLFNIGYYATHLESLLSQILLGVFSVLFVLYCCIQMYVYPLIASLKLPLNLIYRNAMIFTAIRLFPTIVILAIQLVLVLVIPGSLILLGGAIGYTIAIVLYLVLVFGLSHFLSGFFVWHQIEKHMLPDEESDDSESNESISGNDEEQDHDASVMKNDDLSENERS